MGREHTEGTVSTGGRLIPVSFSVSTQFHNVHLWTAPKLHLGELGKVLSSIPSLPRCETIFPRSYFSEYGSQIAKDFAIFSQSRHAFSQSQKVFFQDQISLLLTAQGPERELPKFRTASQDADYSLEFPRCVTTEPSKIPKVRQHFQNLSPGWTCTSKLSQRSYKRKTLGGQWSPDISLWMCRASAFTKNNPSLSHKLGTSPNDLLADTTAFSTSEYQGKVEPWLAC